MILLKCIIYYSGTVSCNKGRNWYYMVCINARVFSIVFTMHEARWHCLDACMFSEALPDGAMLSREQADFAGETSKAWRCPRVVPVVGPYRRCPDFSVHAGPWWRELGLLVVEAIHIVLSFCHASQSGTIGYPRSQAAVPPDKIWSHEHVQKWSTTESFHTRFFPGIVHQLGCDLLFQQVSYPLMKTSRPPLDLIHK